MSADSPDASSARRHVLLGLKIVVSLALLALLFSWVDVGKLWAVAKGASLPWLAIALSIYGLSALASTWRWHLLLEAQDVRVTGRRLLGSFLIASFFNNFLPSNIGGDVIRIGDTARAAGSKTLATTVVLMDRGLGLMALVLVAAIGDSYAGAVHPSAVPILPVWLWAGFLLAAAVATPAVFAPAGLGRVLQPLTVFHPEWIGSRIDTFTSSLARFGEEPGALATCFAGAVFVQGAMVVFYFTVAYALHLDLTFADLSVVVPISFVVQMLPVSVSGFGVREATFSFYFSRIGHPIESAVLMSLVAQVLVMIFSLSGAGVYLWRHRHPAPAV